MSYDADGPFVPLRHAPMDGRDLEAIVTLLELAVIELTPDESATFTFDEMLAKAREIGGPEINLREGDVRIVAQFSGHLLEKLPGGRYRMK